METWKSYCVTAYSANRSFCEIDTFASKHLEYRIVCNTYLDSRFEPHLLVGKEP